MLSKPSFSILYHYHKYPTNFSMCVCMLGILLSLSSRLYKVAILAGMRGCLHASDSVEGVFLYYGL